MSIKVGKNLRLFRDYKVYVKDLDEAFKLGYFTGSMTRWELIERIEKVNPLAKVYASQTHRGLFIDNKFICGIGHNLTIPQFTLIHRDKSLIKTLNYANVHGEIIGHKQINKNDKDGRIMMRSWKTIFNFITQAGYEVDTYGL